MTTGRINQVTIVRRGWPPAPERRRDLVPERHLRAADSDRMLRRAGSAVRLLTPRRQSEFPPLGSPGLPSTALNIGGFGAPGGGPGPATSTMAVSVAGGSPLMLSFSTRQRPAIHRAHAAAGPPSVSCSGLPQRIPATSCCTQPTSRGYR